MEFHGKHETRLLYTDNERAVIVDTLSNTVVSIDESETLIASAQWDASVAEPEGPSAELARAAVTELDIKVLSANDRMYTIPKSVVSEAKRGLAWRKEEKRGGTPVGLNNARTLLAGGQVGIQKVRHIAKYFPRHEVDKKAKGYKPGEKNYPSNGRIAWALWGGDAAQRWASAIVERENAQGALTSGGYDEYYAQEKLDYGSYAATGVEPDFYIRINLTTGGIDRLYKVDEDGTCKVWDNCSWEDMGNVENDFETYDKALDGPYDRSQKTYIPVDRDTAIACSAMLDNAPMEPVFLKQINFDETEMFEAAMPELDFELLDQFSDETPDFLEEEDEFDDGLMASGVAMFAEQPSVDTSPGVDTPEERSERAETQVRDMMGRFSKNGSTVIIGGDANYKGVITAQDAKNETVTVELANGESVTVAGGLTQQIDTFKSVATSDFPSSNLDFSGILGQPRTPIDQPNAQLPGTLPPLSASNVNTLVGDYNSWAGDQRLAPEYSGDPIPPFVPKAVPDINTALGRYHKGSFNPDGTAKPGWSPATTENVYNEPLLRDWLDSVYGDKSGKGSGQTYSSWYTPKTYSGIDVDDKKSRNEVVGSKNRSDLDKKFDPTRLSVEGLTAAADGKARELTPESTDVKPLYLAIVADDDPQAVMNLVCLIPATTKTTVPVTFIRKPGKWVKDAQILADLNSPTPPPVIVLDTENLAVVTEQIDGESVTASVTVKSHFALTNNSIISALMAAGGADRNKGNAGALRRYWTVGKGGLKIRWNTPGDWTRCNRQLKKYMGPRAKGYCALRHKEMTGVWPGDKNNVGKKKGKALKASAEKQTTELLGLKTEAAIIEMATLRARATSAKSRMAGRTGATPTEHGAKFSIPLVIPEGSETGDGRIFQKGSISMRDLPLPLLWQIKTGNGHDGSVVVGQITYMERTDEGIGNAIGVFDSGEFGQEAERLVRYGFIRGVSADMDKFEADEEAPEDTGDDSKDISSGRINITSARVMAVTIVPKPAFQECFIQIVDERTNSEEETMQPDGIYVDNVNPLDASALVACGIVAGAIPNEPPISWFDDPKLKKATPLTIGDDGRVFGHIAAWHVDHIGMAFGTKPPRSRSKYSYFHTGVVRTDDGSDVPVGQLTLAGGHAGLEASAQQAAKHYDDTGSAFADVHAGEDSYGIWVAGSLRSGTSPEQIRAARASAPSGDWRPIKGSLELVAVCQVNVPGFPIARARVASGQVMALVAAGASMLAQLKSDPLAELNARIDALAVAQSEPQLVDARTRFAQAREEIRSENLKRMTELSDRVKGAKKEDDESIEYMIQMMDDDPENELAVVPRRVRRRLAREGKAMPDGSFPIRNISDLRNAVRAYGRAKAGAKGAVRKHIMVRARGLNRIDLLPPKWSTQYSADGEELSLHERTLAISEALSLKKSPDSENLEALFTEKGFTAAAGDEEDLKGIAPEEIEALRVEKTSRENEDATPKFTPDTQPRDTSGRFRKVLARLKTDLGIAGLNDAVEKAEEIENFDESGDVEQATESAQELIGIVDRLDAKALNPEALENVRESSGKLGEVIANLPFEFGEEAQKIRYSDVPAPLQQLMEEMIDRVEAKIGDEDADIATADLKRFMSGGDYFNQSEISSEMAKLLRLLT